MSTTKPNTRMGTDPNNGVKQTAAGQSRSCSPLRYSHQQPTMPGWYWCRTDEPWEAVVRVDKDDLGLFCIWLTAPSPNSLGSLRADEWLPKTLWAGPITPP